MNLKSIKWRPYKQMNTRMDIDIRNVVYTLGIHTVTAY